MDRVVRVVRHQHSFGVQLHHQIALTQPGQILGADGMLVLVEEEQTRERGDDDIQHPVGVGQVHMQHDVFARRLATAQDSGDLDRLIRSGNPVDANLPRQQHA